jgi:RIO kinase 1
MRTPDTLTALVDHGIIEQVLRPLMSGKEAQIYLVESAGEQRVAKIYKEAQNRTFQNRADYTEGRKVRNSRDQRAMGSRSKHGRAQNEAAWKTAEVEMIYRLREAGVRVPVPYNFIDGVLIMELVTDAEGFPAARLGDLTFEPAEATAIFQRVLAEVVRMLCAGVVHGDLSDFNVLLSADGPVIIDFPQAVDASSNQNARKLLLRDVENLHRFHSKFVPDAVALPYAEEMWELYSRNALTPETPLTGKFRGAKKVVSTDAVVDLIADAERDERRRREGLRLSMRGIAPEARTPAGDGSKRALGRASEERSQPRDARPGARVPGQARDARGGGRDVRAPERGPRPQAGAAQARDARGAAPPRVHTQRQDPRGPQAPARQPERAPREGAERAHGQAAGRAPVRDQRAPDARGDAREGRAHGQAGEGRGPARTPEVRTHDRDGRTQQGPSRDTRGHERNVRAPEHDARTNQRDARNDREPRAANERAAGGRDPRGANERFARTTDRVGERDPRAPERTAEAARQLAQQGLRPAKSQRPSSSWGQRSDRAPGQDQTDPRTRRPR